jgi:hypothetical protein
VRILATYVDPHTLDGLKESARCHRPATSADLAGEPFVIKKFGVVKERT